MEDSQRFGYPASFAQERIWFIEQLLPNSPVFNVTVALSLPAAVAPDLLQRAIDILVRRHDVLRTHLEMLGDELLQVVSDDVRVSLAVVDLSSDAPWSQNTEAMARLRELGALPFALDAGPLIRLTLLQRGVAEQLLQVVMHHSITDGWSLRLLVDELMTLYRGLLAGQPVQLPELPVQYADYAVWQRQRMQGATLARLLDYWQQRLRDVPDLLLPTDRPYPQVPTLRGRRCPVRITAQQLSGIDEIARQLGATRFTVVLAAFQLLLYRYSGQTRFTVGTVIANRERRELETLIGFFANTLVLPANLEGAPNFRELVGRVHEQTLGALEHQELPFEKLVEAMQPRRSLTQNPLFQVLFILQDSAAIGSHADDRVLETLEVDAGVSNFDLSFDLWPVNGGLEGRFEYSVDVFDADTIERMVQHFGLLLSAAIAEPERSVDLLNMMAPAERAQLITAARSNHPAASPACVQQLFVDQARRTPDAVAVIDAGNSLSYQELDSKAACLAAKLRGYGVGRGHHVALILDSSDDLIVSILAVLKAGGTYVPLPPTWPERRLNEVLVELGPALVVLHACNAFSPQAGLQVLALDAPGLWSGEPLVESDDSHPEDAAYVIYTSGTTGTPKGVMVPHRAIANHLAWSARVVQLGVGDRALQLASPTFDVSVWEVFGPLVQGATVMIPPQRDDPGRVGAFIRDNDITVLQLVPYYLRELLEGGGLDGSAVRAVFCGGEAMPRALHDRFLDHCRATLFNAYGPTETTIDAVVWRCRATSEGGRVPIGFPIDGVCTHVVGSQGQLCPIGVPGELWIGGAGVALGYLGDPELTEQRFVGDPFETGGGRFYRSGDRVRRLANGELDWLGRLDRQVKVGGLRIELDEIEAAVQALPEVSDAAVVAHTRAEGEQALVAYYMPVADQPPLTAGELRRRLRSRLVRGAIPALFIPTEELPRTASGKVDYRRLSLVPEHQARQSRPPSGPISPGLLRSGRSCWTPGRPVRTMISSRWGGIHCWRPGWWRGFWMRSASTCRCG